ncbi:heavy-metal-associated domain-containing protein [Antarcticimicrobium luteum]|uniref:Copper chaperone n=1 Tax=Antarcticimicrobium luteum TaxID=2547397 RepID=A0A4R5V975_9RHOB|nr:heavy-metal-associated domain-containing protein [Antarcticimicrobium luteum]TDK48116.1 copper chaperone [Antarcticimicrobium luteum]
MNFTVPDMSCGHCTATIETAIKAQDPAATVVCDIAARSVSVQSVLAGGELAAAMSHAGYPATPDV